MRTRLFVVLSLMPLAVGAQKSGPLDVAAPLPLRATVSLAGVSTVYDISRLERGEFAALVRIADHTGIVWLDASLKELRRVEYRSVRNGEMLRFTSLTNGGLAAAVESTRGSQTTYGVRMLDAQGALQRLIPLSGEVTAVHALPGGDVLAAVFDLQSDGNGSARVLRLTTTGAIRWSVPVPRAKVNYLAVASDAFYATATDPLAEDHDRVLRGTLNGALDWDLALPWTDAAGAAVERALDAEEVAATPSYARNGIVAVESQGVTVFAAGGASFARFLPVRYELTLNGVVSSGPIITAVREAWGRGRLPASGWAPTAFPTGAEANADGTYTLAIQYEDGDGEDYAALARVRADGTTRRVWWGVTRDRLFSTTAGWVFVQSGRAETQLSLVDGVP